MIYAADKLSKLRELRIRLRVDPAFIIRREGQDKLDHYWASLAMLERALGEHPLVEQLRFELEAIRDLPPGPALGQMGRSQKRSSRQRARNGSMAAPSAISIIPASVSASRPVALNRPVASLP